MMLMMIAMMMKAATSNKVRLNGLLSGERWYRRASIAFACPPSFSPPSFPPPSSSPPSSPPLFLLYASTLLALCLEIQLEQGLLNS